MNFVSIDFETANSERDSVCSLGIAVVENGKIANTASWLIRPPKLMFNPYNTMIHGISEKDVIDEPEFGQLWSKIHPYLEDKPVVAHNASFDFSVLRHILDTYKIQYPSLTYYCSVILSKGTWTNLESYKLNNIGNFLGIEFKHHDALEDAVTAAKIMIEACNIAKVDSLEALAKMYNVNCGKLYPGGYSPTSSSKKSKKPKKVYGTKAKDISTTNTEFNDNHPCFQKSFVFTGSLKTIKRITAMQLVVDNGGYVHDMVFENTDFLVYGEQNLSRLKDGKKSAKQKIAETLQEKGHKIKIISEEEFCSIL